MQKLVYHVKSEAEMMALGAKLVKFCSGSVVVYLKGELGAGKTTLVRGFLRALGHKGVVKSPTYTLVEPYLLQDKHIYHFDLYRIVDQLELEYIGIRDYFGDESLCLIEWPERAVDILPKADIICKFEIVGPERIVEISGRYIDCESI